MCGGMVNDRYLAEEGGRLIQPQRSREGLSRRSSSVPSAPTQIHQLSLPAGQHALDEGSNPDIQDFNELLLPTMAAKTRSVSRRQPCPRPGTAFERCGVLATTVLVVGTIIALATLAFLTFLWFASTNNTTWHRIASRNWMTRAVSLTALFLRTAISAQASVLTSMLAGVALEGRQVLAIQVASISSMRNANGGPFWLTYQSLQAVSKLTKRTTHMYVLLTMSILLLCTLLIQFSSTALIADLQLHPLHGDTVQGLQQTNFIYDPTQLSVDASPLKHINRAPTWTLHPAVFPTFAEHSEVPLHSGYGVSDTGLALRAFLPLRDQQSRYSIRNYTGRATVVDSSVVCMRPELSGTVLYQRETIVFVSRIQPSSKIPSITMNPVSDGLYASSEGSFSSCAISPSVSSSRWGLSFCQIQGSGSLRSAFTNTSTNVTGGGIFGATYLALNFTSGTYNEWSQHMGGAAFTRGGGQGGFKPPSFADNGEWLDLLFTSNGSLRLSVSLCYAAWDSADLFIEASSNQNRTEPVPIFDRVNTKWRYDSIRRQLGQSTEGPWVQGMIKDRGLLELAERQSWIPSGADYARPDYARLGWQYDNQSRPIMSFLLDAAKLEKTSGPPSTNGLTKNLAAGYSVIATGNPGALRNESTTGSFCVSIMLDQSMTGIIQEILQNGGDIAHALQSFITVSSGLTYYDQLPQFNGDSPTHQTMLIYVLTPVRYRGYVAVFLVSSVYLVLTAVIVGLFFAKTNVSTVGNAWQSVAQVKDIKTENIIDHATLMSNKDVKSWMKKDSSSSGKRTLAWDDIVGIEQSESGDRTQIMCGSPFR